MNIKIIKNNKGPASPIVHQGGFTLVETMFAVMILTFVIVGMMTIVASSLFSARYARDEITASYLLQEVVDYMRNDRDTSVFLQKTQTVGVAWNTFANKYSASCSTASRGCYFDILSNPTPVTCSTSGCPKLCYNDLATSTAFYYSDVSGCTGTGVTSTNFQRKIVAIRGTNPDELNVTVSVSYLNGTQTKTRTLSTTIMKWQP